MPESFVVQLDSSEDENENENLNILHVEEEERLSPPASQSSNESALQQMLASDGRTFPSREELECYVRTLQKEHGYVLSIKLSERNIRVSLKCDRGGMYRNRNELTQENRKRETGTRLIDCHFLVR